MNSTIQQLLKDLQPAVKQELIRVYPTRQYDADTLKIDIIFPLALRRHRSRLAKYITQHYNCQVRSIGTLMLFVTATEITKQL